MPVVIVKESSYEYGQLRLDVFDILTSLDPGIRKDTRVLIKPNLLCAARPEQAITTHPLVIKSAAEYAISKGAQVQVSDSPATGSFQKIIRDCGMEEALSGMPVTIKALDSSRDVTSSGTFGTIELSSEALDADVIINLPKLKTHSQMALTLAIKNLFGCVVGMRKPEWHFRVGENKELFAEVLASVHNVLKPSINLMDGILAMEGDGPGTGGTPRRLGILMGSDSALSLDMAVCAMVGMEPSALLTNRAARSMGLAGEFELSGGLPSVTDFSIPDIKDLVFGPAFAREFLRRHVATRPSSVPEECRLCDECVKMCPAGAISNADSKLGFDYERCIRCYCCLEVCPHGAIKRRETLIKKVITAAARIIRR